MAAKVVLRRENPPLVKPRGCGRGREPKWPAILAAVAAGKGAWFRAGEFKNSNSAGSAARAAKRHDAADRFEFTARTEGDKGVLYARLKTA